MFVSIFFFLYIVIFFYNYISIWPYYIVYSLHMTFELVPFKMAAPIESNLMISHKVMGPDCFFFKSRFWTKSLTWVFTYESKFEKWLESVSCTFYWRLKFLSYFLSYIFSSFKYLLYFFSTSTCLSKSQVFVILFFLCPTICCTFVQVPSFCLTFCSTSKYLLHFFSISNFCPSPKCS